MLLVQEAKREEETKHMDLYMRTQPNATFWTQLKAIIMRRFLVFIREPRQWFMIIGPFVNVLSMILLIDVFILAIAGSTNDTTKKIMRIITADLFPFFLLYGFCLSSGIFMIVSLFDKEKKMRQYMFLNGVGPMPYYFGLFLADFLLYFITQGVFALFVWAMQLKAFSEQMWQFLALMTCFGIVLIPFTYMFQHFFKNSDTAFRNIGIVYILFGILLPGVLEVAVGVVTFGSTNAMIMANAACYFVDPFFTFFDGVRDLLVIYLSKLYADKIYHIPVTRTIFVTT